jgi:hypothetical protein
MNQIELDEPLLTYEGEETQRLADEAINKIRYSFLERMPASLFPDADIDEIRMEVMGNLMEWRTRYLQVLGKMKYFLENYPLCQQLFTLRRLDPNSVTGGVVLSLRGRLGSEDGDFVVVDDAADDIESVVSSAVHDLPAGGEQELNTRAFSAIKEVLLRQPQCSMRLTLLNTVARWYLFNALCSSLKVWARQHLRGDGTHCLVVINGTPGNDVVQLVPRSEAAAFSAPASIAPDLSAPVALSALGRPAPVARARSLVDSRTGIYVEEFFTLPLRTCTTEISYKKAMSRISAMLGSFVQQGVISNALSYNTDRFEELEWLGDAVLHMELTRSQFVSHSLLLDVGGLSVRRQNAEQRLTLALLFDELRIAEWMLICPESWVSEKWKAKGDILEAILGEIYMKLNVATETGFLLDPKQRETGERLIQMITAAALERGPRLKDAPERRSLTDAAQSSGGGGLLPTRMDGDAMVRHSRSMFQER